MYGLKPVPCAAACALRIPNGLRSTSILLALSARPKDVPCYKASSPRVFRSLRSLCSSLEPRELQKLRGPDREQRLAEFDGLAVGHQAFDDFAGGVSLNFIHQLHGLYDADDLALFNAVAGRDKRRGAG